MIFNEFRLHKKWTALQSPKRLWSPAFVYLTNLATPCSISFGIRVNIRWKLESGYITFNSKLQKKLRHVGKCLKCDARVLVSPRHEFFFLQNEIYVNRDFELILIRRILCHLILSFCDRHIFPIFLTMYAYIWQLISIFEIFLLFNKFASSKFRISVW